MSIRMLLDYSEAEWENVILDFPAFGAKKPTYPKGQVPVLTLDDGTMLCETKAIYRYVAAQFKGKNGENLYPKLEDPVVCQKIDAVIDFTSDLFTETLNFTVPMIDAYKQKDEHFTTFITTSFPKYLKRLDDILTENGTKYLFTKQMTAGDLFAASIIMRVAHNDEYEYCHILQAVISKQPKVQSWLSAVMANLGDWMNTQAVKNSF